MAFYGVHGPGSSWLVSPGANGVQQQHGASAAEMSSPWRRGGAAGEMQPSSTTLAQVMAAGRTPEPWMIWRDALRAAEATAREVALRVHPTGEAERRRQDVIGYLRRLLGSTFGFEVFAYGSVPLKTYLPDGDVDITVLANTWLNSSLIHDVRHVLNMEMENCDAELQVKSLQFIDADVKLLKCVIDNTIVDISFNQIGGVSTFCFLELIDRQVGRDHLFKRSIMLIKTWCYHEGRILGAHHGLLSTYAMETLVLYIFNMFHKSLHGPLEALHRFLDYFSKFDWDKYAICLFGPVLLSSLPDITIESTVAPDELLLGHEFLQCSSDRVVINGSSGRDTNFRPKFLNIIDPIKGNNNLGRSVSKGNFYHIRNAISVGAQKLGQILMLPSEHIPGEICGFFANTLKRHGNGERRDLGDFSSFESLDRPEHPSEHVSSLKMSSITEGENRISSNSPKLADKESNGAQMLKNSSTSLQDDAQVLPWNKIWFMEQASDFGANSSFSQLDEKQPLPPFPVSDMLDISGDLDMQLGCLRKVHYHLEYLFEELQASFEEAYLAGEVDEDFFKVPTTLSLEARPQRITIAGSSASAEAGKLSPVYCPRGTEDVYHQQPQVEDQAEVVWQQNLPLSPSGFPFCSSPVSSNPDTYPVDTFPVAWVNACPKSHGTGTYIPKVSYDMYRERMARLAPERAFLRRQRPRLLAAARARNGNGHAASHDESPVKQKGSFQKTSADPEAVVSRPVKDQTATQRCETKQAPAKLAKKTEVVVPSSPSSTDDNNSSKGSDDKEEGQLKAQAAPMTTTQPSAVGTMAVLQFGQGIPSASLDTSCEQPSSAGPASFRQLKAKVAENLEFGSVGPFSLGLLAAQFEKAFPPLPAPSKKPEAHGPASTGKKSPEPAVVTQSRPQEAFRLRDEAEFPPLRAGCHALR